MKKLKARITNIIKLIKWFFIDCYGWCRSICIIAFKGIKRARLFYGYGHYKLACRFAAKRCDKWKCWWDQMGKLQGVFPVESEETPKLIVCSQLEIKGFQKRKLIKTNISYRKMFKRSSYHKTQYKYKTKK